MTEIQASFPLHEFHAFVPTAIGSGILALLTGLAAVLTFAVLIFLVGYILIKGIPYLTPELFSFEYNSENVSLMPSLINTFIMTVLTLVIAAPIGIFAAIYLVEYAQKGNRLVKVIRITARHFPVFLLLYSDFSVCCFL